MEGRKQVGASSSSFTSELFGSKEDSSSMGIFGSIFAPSPKVLGRESVRSQVAGNKQYPGNESSTTKLGAPDGLAKRRSEADCMLPSDMNSNYQEQRVHPCHLSSSIYYGGQDLYSHPQSTQSAGLNSFKKDGGEDDSGSASRGNWWQGSLYY